MTDAKTDYEKMVRPRDKSGRLLPIPVESRFKTKYVIDGECWRWVGAKDGADGVYYGRFYHRGVTMGAHRAAWEIHNKREVPKGMTIDHLCENTLCVNPEHLKLATQWENNSRGNSACAKNARKVKCPRGHFYGDKNTKVIRTGKRCRSCANEKAREKWASESSVEQRERKKAYMRAYGIKRRAKAAALSTPVTQAKDSK